MGHGLLSGSEVWAPFRGFVMGFQRIPHQGPIPKVHVIHNELQEEVYRNLQSAQILDKGHYVGYFGGPARR